MKANYMKLKFMLWSFRRILTVGIKTRDVQAMETEGARILRAIKQLAEQSGAPQHAVDKWWTEVMWELSNDFEAPERNASPRG